jgi:hypothetical protein
VERVLQYKEREMSEKLYNGITPKNDNLTVAEWGGRVHNVRREPMAVELHKRLKEKLKNESK